MKNTKTKEGCKNILTHTIIYSKIDYSVKVVIYNIYLSQSEDTLLGSNTTSLDHDKVLLDQTVMGEPAHGVDGLIGQVVIGGSIVLDKLKFKT